MVSPQLYLSRIQKMKESVLTRDKFVLPGLAQRNLGPGPSFALAAHSKVTLAGVHAGSHRASAVITIAHHLAGAAYTRWALLKASSTRH